MVDISKFDSINTSNALNYNDFKVLNHANINGDDVSIFAGEDTNVELLNEQLAEIQAEQGFFSNSWNEVKEFIGVGATVEKCDEAIEKYKKGEMTFEEASAVISNFDVKQESSLNLFSNIATGVAAIVAATAAGAAIVASGGTATPLVLAAVGAGTGAVTKASYKLTDRATNEKKGDALNGKQIAKDFLSGAVTGGIGAATMGTGSAGSSLGTSMAASAARSAKTGVITGTISGSSNYLIDTAFDEDKKFNTKEFLATTATSAAVGTAVGGIMGGANGAMRYTGVIKHGGMVKVDGSTGKLLNASTNDVVANSVCNAEYKLVNQGIRNTASTIAA